MRSKRPALTADRRRDTLRTWDNALLMRMGFQGIVPDKRRLWHKCRTCADSGGWSTSIGLAAIPLSVRLQIRFVMD
ncbi:hypothetical protein AGATL06_25600 [Agathobaculum sp. TL06]